MWTVIFTDESGVAGVVGGFCDEQEAYSWVEMNQDTIWGGGMTTSTIMFTSTKEEAIEILKKVKLDLTR
jgi:hypothetical protein